MITFPECWNDLVIFCEEILRMGENRHDPVQRFRMVMQVIKRCPIPVVVHKVPELSQCFDVDISSFCKPSRERVHVIAKGADDSPITVGALEIPIHDNGCAGLALGLDVCVESGVLDTLPRVVMVEVGDCRACRQNPQNLVLVTRQTDIANRDDIASLRNDATDKLDLSLRPRHDHRIRLRVGQSQLDHRTDSVRVPIENVEVHQMPEPSSCNGGSK